MSNTGYMVYWTEALSKNFGARSQHFTMAQMSEALAFMNDLRRKQGVEFVTFVSQDPDRVGRDGVDSVKDGKTPDGHNYEWSKQHRGAAPRKPD